MNEDINYLIDNAEFDKKPLLNYITNLQEDLEKANDIIEKDRQFYKCRMDEYIKLKEENEFLKLNNPEMNIEHFRIIKENKRKIDNLRKENKRLKETIKQAKEKTIKLQEKYNYILDDLTFILARGINYEWGDRKGKVYNALLE